MNAYAVTMRWAMVQKNITVRKKNMKAIASGVHLKVVRFDLLELSTKFGALNTSKYDLNYHKRIMHDLKAIIPKTSN